MLIQLIEKSNLSLLMMDTCIKCTWCWWWWINQISVSFKYKINGLIVFISVICNYIVIYFKTKYNLTYIYSLSLCEFSSDTGGFLRVRL